MNKKKDNLKTGDEVVVDSTRLLSLVSKWRNIAKRKFKDSENERETQGKRLIEHGAMCYFNAYRELEEIINSSQSDS